MSYTVRADLGGLLPSGKGRHLLSLVHLSDAHVIDTVSPARCEWVELLAHDPLWKPLLHMHRPYEALTHWALAAHVANLRNKPQAPYGGHVFDLALSTGDNIDNAQFNELQTFLKIMAGGQTRLSAVGGVHEPSGELGDGPWPFWCPQADVADNWKTLGYPVVDDYVPRVSAPLTADGLGFAWASLPGNHDFMRQGTALTAPAIEAIAVGEGKTLRRPSGFAPTDPLSLFVSDPELFSQGVTRRVQALPERRAVDKRSWLAAHVQHGALGYDRGHVERGSADTCIDLPEVRIILLDTNHPGGDYQGSIGASQLVWLDERLAEVAAQPGRIAVLASHHGSVSLINTRGDDPQRMLSEAMLQVVQRYPCVVAWLVGHRHLHRIVAHAGPQPGKGGFWEITTASVIDWPSQTRAVEFFRHPHGAIEIVCTLQDHQASVGSLAHLHRQLSRQFAADKAGHMQGAISDGSVRLLRP